MHRCSNSHGNMMGQCTCGSFHTPTNSFSMLFSMQAPTQTDICPFISSSSSSSAVDCTLSLGTPSTRLSNENNNFNNNNNNGKGVAVQHERRSSYMPNFCWDILQTKHNPSPPPTHHNKSTRGGTHTTSISSGDPLLARRCANCDTTSTPLWRNGPRGPKSLCNACGIRFKKEERRASTAAAGTTTTSGGAAIAPGGIMESQHMINSNNSWVHHQYSQSTAQKIPCISPSFGNEFRFMEDDDRDSESGIPFLSWRLNVTDRPSLVHDFTR